MALVPDLEPFFDIPLVVEALLEGPRLRMRELLALKSGSVVVTRFPAGENVDVVAGSSIIGAGELTVSGKRMAVRLLGFRGAE